MTKQYTISLTVSVVIGNVPADLSPAEIDELTNRLASSIRLEDDALTEAMEDLDLAGDPEIVETSHSDIVVTGVDE